MRRALTERLIRGHDPRIASILRVGGGVGGGGGVLPSGEFIIWVTKGGSDTTGDGTDEAPYLTIAKAMSVAAAMTLSATQQAIILLGPGVYTENVPWVPWVFLSGLDPTAFSAEIDGNVTLNGALWVAVGGPAVAGASAVTVTGNATLDFTGTGGTSTFQFGAQTYVIGNVTVTGDPANSGELIVRDMETNGTTTITAAQLESHQLTCFDNVAIVSTAAQQAGWSASNTQIGGEGTSPSVTCDSTAGQPVVVELLGSQIIGGGPLNLAGAATSYSATAGGIPGQIVRTSGAPAPVLVRYASSQVPDATFEIYVDKSGNDTDGNGTQGAPYLTLGKAMTVAKTLTLSAAQGCTVLVAPGTYAESVAVPPFVLVTAITPNLTAFTYVTGNITIDAAAWVALGAGSAGYAGVTNVLVEGNLTLDFSGIDSTSSAGFSFDGPAGAVGGATTLTGNSTGNVDLDLDEVTTIGDVNVTGASLSPTKAQIGGNVLLTTTATAGIFFHCNTCVIDGGSAITLDATAGQFINAHVYTLGFVTPVTLTLHDGAGVTHWESDAISVPANVVQLGGAGFPGTASPLWGAYFAPILPPPSPTVPFTYASGSITGTGNAMASTSDQGAITVMSIAGGSHRDFMSVDATELLAIAGGGGSASADYGLPAQFCGKVHVCVVGTGATGSDGFCEEATATVRVTAGGVAAFPAAVGGSSNPTLNPWLDKVSDTTFNSGGGVPSAIALSVAGGNLVVTVTNNGVGANNFVVYFHLRSFGSP